MFHDKYIIRADFYPNGDIVPLGITNTRGKTIFIKKIDKIERSGEEYRFFCSTNEFNLLLTLRNNTWTVKKNL